MSSLSSNEKGYSTLLAMIGAAAFILLITDGHHSMFELRLHPTLYWSLIASVGIVTLFLMGYAVHMRLIGSKPDKQIHRELLARSTMLDRLSNETMKQIIEYERLMAARADIMTRKGTECLSLVKRIVKAVEQRNSDIRQLLKSKNQIQLIDAHDLLESKLHVDNNCLESLIDSEPIPALAPYEWEPTLGRLLAEIETEIQLVESAAA